MGWSISTGRRTAMRRVIESREVKNGIVFCNRKSEVDIVAKSLSKHGHDAAPIHGDLPQAYRTQTLEKFRNGELKLLVASDVAARGLDIPDVGHVFNYSPPPNSDDYVHRIGRTGRAGRTGESFTLVCPEDGKLWDAVLKRVQKDVETFMPEGLEDELKALGPSSSSRSSKSSSRGKEKSSPRGKERPEKSSNREKSRKSDRGGNDFDLLPPAPAGPVVGLGDHVPAFLQRPV